MSANAGYVILIGNQDHERCRRTDEECIDVYRKCLHEALLCRVVDLCRRCSVRSGSLSGFIGIDAAFYAPAYRRAESGHRREDVLHDQAEDGG